MKNRLARRFWEMTVLCLLLGMGSGPVSAADTVAVQAEKAVQATPPVPPELAALFSRAEGGNARAQMQLGLRYVMGRGVPADDALAQTWLEKAAGQGNAVAQLSLASLMVFESDVQDAPGAAVWYGRAAEQGNAQARSELARMLESGTGVARDPEEARQWRQQAAESADKVMLAWVWRIAQAGCEAWRRPVTTGGESVPVAGKAGEKDRCLAGTVDPASVRRDAEAGNTTAQTVSGYLLATGEGEMKDEAAALNWFSRAAHAGNARAQAVLGELTALGWGGLKPDAEEAASWMRRSAEQGLREAQTSYGSMLAGGKGVKASRKAAFVWIRKAADQDEARAQLMMAMNALSKGDREGAAQWFYRAAENGDDEVLSVLGVLYGRGEGAVAGESEKLTEVRRYAQRGEPEAQLMLGLLYGEGWGTVRDPARAEEWFRTAASAGYDEVWLPLGLLYAETGQAGKARHAFDQALEKQAFSFARDRDILRLMFADPGVLPEPEEADIPEEAAFDGGDGEETEGDIASPMSPDEEKTVAVPGRNRKETESPVTVREERSMRIAKKAAFLKERAALGDPAAELMMATLLAEGWGVARDEAMARQMQDKATETICASEAAASEPACLPEEADGPDGEAPADEDEDTAQPEPVSGVPDRLRGEKAGRTEGGRT